MIALMIMGNWLLNEIVSFMQMLWGSFGQYNDGRIVCYEFYICIGAI